MAIDYGYTVATCYLSLAYNFLGQNDKGKELCLKVYNKRDGVEIRTKIMIEWLYALDYGTSIYDQVKSLKQYLEIDYQNPIQHYLLGIQYMALGQFENAASDLEKSLEISRKLDLKPFWVYCYTDLGKVYHKEGRFKKGKDLYKVAEEDYPDNTPLLYRKAILALSQRHEKEAAEYISRYRSVRKEMSASMADISSGLASIYEEADLPDKAEEYFHQALLSEPENPWMLNILARFLIEKNRIINEGLELIDKALKINPLSSDFLDA